MTGKSKVGTPPESRCAQVLLHVHELMKDGKWHYWEDVVKAVTPKVQRSVAGRMGEKDRVRNSRRSAATTVKRREQPTESSVRSGARSMIGQAVRSSERWFERRGPRGKRQIRMKGTPTRLVPYVDPEDLIGGGICPHCTQRLPGV